VERDNKERKKRREMGTRKKQKPETNPTKPNQEGSKETDTYIQLILIDFGK
jgi:hypothetical protein